MTGSGPATSVFPAGPLTRPDIRRSWPAGVPVPSHVTPYRWLEPGVADGLVVQSGTGPRNDPFTYARPGREEQPSSD